MMNRRFTQADDHGWEHGFFPSFHETSYGRGMVYRTFLVEHGAAG